MSIQLGPRAASSRCGQTRPGGVPIQYRRVLIQPLRMIAMVGCFRQEVGGRLLLYIKLLFGKY